MSILSKDHIFAHGAPSRRVPVREYLPQTPPVGLILFSVGYGGQASGYGFLGRKWAGAGFSTFVIEHVGSNLDVLKTLAHLPKEERNREVVRRVQEPRELQARAHDVATVLEAVRARFAGLPWGLGGHSYGSYSALAGAGLQPRQTSTGISSLRPDALLLISPQPPGLLFTEEEYGEVDCPSLILTGTRDELLSGESSFKDRLQVYHCLPPPYRQVLVQQGTDHMAFAGVGLKLEEHLKTAQNVTTLWWERQLLGRHADSDWCALVRGHLPSERIHLCR